MNLSLMRALRASNPSAIAFAGAGGKTTAIFQLAREFSASFRVLVTASTHLGIWQVPWADKHLVVDSEAALLNLEDRLGQITLLTGALEAGRTKPLAPDLLRWLHEFSKTHALPLLIEADGSRQKPLKAWAKHEPPIPSFVEQVVHVAGLAGIGKPLIEEFVHRPGIFSRLSGLHIGGKVTAEAVTRVSLHTEGGQKNVPPDVRKTILLNQADTPDLQSIAHRMAQELLSSFSSVVVASLSQEKILAAHESVAGIILAAGGSRRFGKPKQLLEWKGQPFVRTVAKTALEAGLDPVIVVTGANGDSVEAAVRDLNARVVRNEDWESGQASSIKEGMRLLRVQNHAGAAVFMLADQPQVNAVVLRALVEKHADGLYPVVAPVVIDRRANPVLFDRETFADLMELQGDIGGRALFQRYRVEYLPWHDDRLLLDVDTPEQYQRLISDDTL